MLVAPMADTPLEHPTLSLRRYGASPGSHAHPHYQVLWGWDGALELDVEGRGARMTAGLVAVIAPGARHDFWAARHERAPARCFVLDTTESALEPLAGRVWSTDPGLAHLLRYFDSRGAEPLPPAAIELLSASLWAGREAARALPRAGRPIDWLGLQAWVDAHLDAPLDVAALAAQVHLSPSQFAARCVAERGLPPLAWLRARRLVAARRLRERGVPVAEAVARCGYRSPSALTAAMRRAGIAP